MPANYGCPHCGGRLGQPDRDLPAYQCERCGEIVREVTA